MPDQPLPRPRTAVDLFSGCGGLTLGLRSAGFKVIGAIERDDLAASTYRANHPGVHLWEADIRRVTVKAVMEVLGLEPGELDLLAGCPPCQGYSAVRTLNGRRRAVGVGPNMVYQFLRFVRELFPKAVMLENVPALAKNWRLEQVGRELKKLGYKFESRVLDAADFGVPQRRRRVILIGSRVGTPTFAAPSPLKKTVRDAIGMIPVPGATGDPCHDFPERRKARVADLIRRIPKDGGSRLALGKEAQLPCHQECDGFKDIYGRMAWNEVSPTITGGCVNPSKGRFLHPDQDRSITLREAALLQGFPRSYTFSLAKGKFAAATMIGNAFPPQFVASHARLLNKHLIAAAKKSG